MLFLFGQLISYNKSGDIIFTNIPKLETNTNIKREEIIDDYDHIISHYCQIYGMDDELVKLIIEKESQFNPRAVSKSGAIGLMQLMPETAEALGVKDPYNPQENIKGGVKFLRDLFDKFGGDLELTLAAYHAGPGIVQRLNRVPNIPETMMYVDYIIARYSGAAKKDLYFTTTEEGAPLLTNRPK